MTDFIREQIRVNEAHSLRAVLPEKFQRSTSDYSNFASERYAASASVTHQLEGNILPVLALNSDLPTPVWSSALIKQTLDGYARSSSLNVGSNDKMAEHSAAETRRQIKETPFARENFGAVARMGELLAEVQHADFYLIAKVSGKQALREYFEEESKECTRMHSSQHLLAQEMQFAPLPTLVPSPEQLGITKETTMMAAETAKKFCATWSKEHPLAGQEDHLMAATTNVANSWENAAATFPQLQHVSPDIMKAYVRNELAFYGREDLAQDMAAHSGHLLGSNPTLGMAQISPKGVTEFEHNYPQLRSFLESRGYTGPQHEMLALLDPKCVPMIVAAKTASIVDDLANHGIKEPTRAQLAYAYNPDVYSYSDGNGGREYKTLYFADVKISHAFHWDQRKEYYADKPDVIANSRQVRNVLSWLK